MKIAFVLPFVTSLLASCYCQVDTYQDENYGDIAAEEDYYGSEEETGFRNQNNYKLASKRPADVQYEVTLEGGKDEDDHHHPSLRKYEFDARNIPTTLRTTLSTTTTTTAKYLRTTTQGRRATNDLSRVRGGQPKIATTEKVQPTPNKINQPDDGNENASEEKGNLLVYLDYRKEDRSCPDGQVLDIYGYCREIFREESRDWSWWTNIRNFIFGSRDSGYQSTY